MSLFSKRRYQKSKSESEEYEDWESENSFEEFSEKESISLPDEAGIDDELLALGDLRHVPKLSAAAAIGFIFAAALLVFSLMSRAELMALSDDCKLLEVRLNEVNKDNEVLRVEREKNYNLFDVESSAKKDLGMQEAGKNQILYLAQETEDRGEVFNVTKNDESPFGFLSDYFKKISSYFNR